MMLLWLVACLAPDAREPVRVFAASSLTDVLHALEHDHEAAFPSDDLQIVTAGSQVLALQIAQGAPADLVATADPEPLADLGERLGPLQPLASNRLVVAVRSDHPLTSAAELPSVASLVVGLPESPIGSYTLDALEAGTRDHGPAWRDAVDARIVSEESNVRLVRTKVELGVADAAIVYASDVPPDGTLRAVPLPDPWQPAITYVVAPTADASPAALRVLDTLTGPTGAAVLARHGLVPAP